MYTHYLKWKPTSTKMTHTHWLLTKSVSVNTYIFHPISSGASWITSKILGTFLPSREPACIFHHFLSYCNEEHELHSVSQRWVICLGISWSTIRSYIVLWPSREQMYFWQKCSRYGFTSSFRSTKLNLNETVQRKYMLDKKDLKMELKNVLRKMTQTSVVWFRMIKHFK